MSAMIFV